MPEKNTKVLNGKPLIGWSIEVGLKSKYIDELMVTTDDPEIAKISKEYGAKVPFIRPTKLALDTTPMFDVVKHTIDYYRKRKNQYFNIIILLEPTSPLRKDNDIDNMLQLLIDKESDYDSIISIGEVHEHPSIMKNIINNILEPYCDQLDIKTRRQDNTPAYFPYGVAYITKCEALLSEETFYTARSSYYKIERYQCYEIDDIYDFVAIEGIMQYERGKR